jgi:hypothetical protein
MYFRVIRGQIQPGKLDEFLRRWHIEIVPKIHAFQDVRHAYMGVDREKNTVSSFTLFESEADEATLDQWVRDFVPRLSDVIVGPPQIEYYEVAEDVS